MNGLTAGAAALAALLLAAARHHGYGHPGHRHGYDGHG
jgi:hypothetical protein